eukprot:scaffold10022_cov156-Skeletonema_marinoi.AAC.21
MRAWVACLLALGIYVQQTIQENCQQYQCLLLVSWKHGIYASAIANTDTNRDRGRMDMDGVAYDLSTLLLLHSYHNTVFIFD